VTPVKDETALAALVFSLLNHKLSNYLEYLKEGNMKEALPQIIFIAVLVINFLTSVIDSNRNSMASLIATIILLALTHWGGFYKPLIDVLTAKI
jgi:hypothetical protein